MIGVSPQRRISRSVNASVGAVHKLIAKAKGRGLGWPPPENVDDAGLGEILYKSKTGGFAGCNGIPSGLGFLFSGRSVKYRQ